MGNELYTLIKSNQNEYKQISIAYLNKAHSYFKNQLLKFSLLIKVVISIKGIKLHY